MGIAMSMKGSQFKQPLLRPRFAATLPAAEAASPAVTAPKLPVLEQDQFVSRIKKEAPETAAASPAKALKASLAAMDWLKKKAALASLAQQVTAVDLQKSVFNRGDFLNPANLEEADKKVIAATAQAIQAMSNQDKLQFVKDMTGERSRYAVYAEKVLLSDTRPSIRETLLLLKPNFHNRTIAGIRESMAALGIALVVMPLVLPTVILFNPSALGQLLLGLGVWLL